MCFGSPNATSVQTPEANQHLRRTPDLLLHRRDALPVISLPQPMCMINEIRVDSTPSASALRLVRTGILAPHVTDTQCA